jgi:hypothetical protein
MPRRVGRKAAKKAPVGHGQSMLEKERLWQEVSALQRKNVCAQTACMECKLQIRRKKLSTFLGYM